MAQPVPRMSITVFETRADVDHDMEKIYLCRESIHHKKDQFEVTNFSQIQALHDL